MEDVFMPWVMDSVVTQLDRVALSRKLAAKVLEAAVLLGQSNTAIKKVVSGEEMSGAAYEKLQGELDIAAAAAAEEAAAAAAEEESGDVAEEEAAE